MASSLGSVILPSVVCSWECFHYCQQHLSWRAWYYTHIRSLPQRWPPLGQISPCTSSLPAVSVYILCVCAYCLPACQPIKSMPSTECLLGPFAYANQPANQNAQSADPPPSLVDRPITGRSSQEGPVTWVIVVALATGIILAWKQEEVKWTFHSLTNSQKLRKRQHVSKNRLPEKEFEVRDSLWAFSGVQLWYSMTQILKIAQGGSCGVKAGDKGLRSWHSPETVFVTSIYIVSSLHPLIPSGLTPLIWALFSGQCVYLSCMCALENKSYVTVVFTAKERDYTTNNPQLWTLTPALRNTSHGMR